MPLPGGQQVTRMLGCQAFYERRKYPKCLGCKRSVIIWNRTVRQGTLPDDRFASS